MRRTAFLIRRPRVLVLAALVSVLAGVPLERAQAAARSEEDLLLLALRIDQLDPDFTLPAYPAGGDTLLPLGALALGLGVGIQVDARAGLAQGFILEEGRRFRLRAGRDTAWVNGAPVAFAPGRIEWHDDDVYVASRLLSAWLPLDLVVDPRRSTLNVHPREPLPLLQRLERQQGYQRTLVAAEPAVEGDRLRAPYRPWGWPASDHMLNVWQRGSSPGASGGFQYTSQLTGDLLYMEGHAYLAGDDRDALRNARLSLGRRDPDPVLLGPLHAREVMAGDVVDPGLELVSYASAGKGGVVSSFPLYDETEYDRRTFHGDLPPGWDVELYRNDALVGYRQAGTGAVYEFADVPLLYGLNRFRLQFYGPQGQTRAEYRTVHLGRSLTPPGRTYYRAMAHVRPDETVTGHAEFSTGLTRQVSLTGRVAGLQVGGSDRVYEGLGLRLGWDRLFVKTDAMMDRTRGGVLQAALATRLGPLGVWAQQAWLDDFQSDVFRPVFGTVQDRTGVRLDLELRRAGWARVPMSLEWRHDGLAGGSIHDLIHQTSIAGRGLGVSNRFQVRFVQLDGASPPVERRGLLLVHRSLRHVNLRGGIEYGFDHGGELRDLSLTAETRRLGPFLAAEVRRTVQTRETIGRLSLTREYGALGMALRSDLSSVNGGGVSALFTVSFDRDPRTRRWHADARPRSESGTVAAQVFLDRNGNGTRDPGEDPIERVRLRATPGGTEASTDADGVAMLRGFPSGHPSEVELVTTSLEDPLRIPRRRDVAVLPRVGSPLLVDFPVVLCGEIAGTVSLRRAGVTRPLAGARLELVAEEDGRVVKRARTAFDGYYDLAAVPPGRYRLYALLPGPPRPDVAGAVVTLVIGPDGPILEPVDLTLVGATEQIAGEGER